MTPPRNREHFILCSRCGKPVTAEHDYRLLRCGEVEHRDCDKQPAAPLPGIEEEEKK